MKYLGIIVGIGYTGLSMFVFIAFLYKEDISLPVALLTPLVLFAPIALSQKLKIGQFFMSLLTVVGAIIGFTSAGLLKDINIWPIALIFWLGLSVPAIAILNLTVWVGNRNVNKS